MGRRNGAPRAINMAGISSRGSAPRRLPLAEDKKIERWDSNRRLPIPLVEDKK